MCTLYDVLGALPSDSASQLRAAFKRRALTAHPDKGGTKEAFQSTVEALEILTNPRKRTRYDLSLKSNLVIATRSFDKGHVAPSDHVEFVTRSGGLQDHKSPRGKANQGKQQQEKPQTKKRLQKQERKEPKSSAAAKELLGATLLQRLCKHLRKLPPARRREIIQHALPQTLRVSLENWMRQREGLARTNKSMDVGLKVSEDYQSPQADSKRNNESSSYSSDENGSVHNRVKTRSKVPALHDDDDSAKSSSTDSSGDSSVVETAALMPVENEMLLQSDSSPTARRQVLSQSTQSARQNRAQVRGISSSNFRKGNIQYTYYAANYMIGFLRVSCRRTKNLEEALDHMVTLNAVRQATLENIDRGLKFEESFTNAFSSVLAESGAHMPSELGLAFHLSLAKSFWIGRRRQLCTPRTNDVSVILREWRLFEDLQDELRCNGIAVKHMLSRYTPAELDSNWKRFCSAYVSCCKRGGLDPEIVLQQLNKLSASLQPHRDLQMEKWNKRRMRAEEKWQQRVRKWELRAEQRERRHMHQADSSRIGRGRSCTIGSEKCIHRLVRQWILKEQSTRRKQARKQTCERAKQMRAKEKIFKKSKEAAWRWKNRRDITMDELLSSSPNHAQTVE